jgi:hypothetical protein
MRLWKFKRLKNHNIQKDKKNKLNINDINFKNLNIFWKEIEDGKSIEDHVKILKKFQKKYNLAEEVIKFANMRYKWNN